MSQDTTQQAAVGILPNPSTVAVQSGTVSGVVPNVGGIAAFPDAPSNGKTYGRVNATWGLTEDRGIRVGDIIGYYGSIINIPVGFALCDGVANAPGPDWSDLFKV